MKIDVYGEDGDLKEKLVTFIVKGIDTVAINALS